MYFLYKELQKAVCAKLCCTCHFFDEKRENIITCSSDTIVIYDIVRCSNCDSSLQSPYRLKVVGQYSFCGEILSIACLPLKAIDPMSSLSNRDAIVMSFKGNYVSFLVYDDEEGNLCNIACYDFNKEAVIALNPSGSEIEFEDNGYVVNHGLLRVDPEFRCVSVLLNHYCFVVIPITVKGLSEHFKIYKSQLGCEGEVKDYCFLPNSVIPTLAILSESMPTWAGTSSYAGSTTSLYLVSIVPSISKYEIVYEYHGLPYDCYCIEPLQSSSQSFLILSSHILFYFISQQAHLIILNNYGKQFCMERANLLPNSVYSKEYLHTYPSFHCLMDNAYITRTSSPDLFYLVSTRGIYRLQITLHQNRVEQVQLSEQAMMMMDVCSTVSVQRDSVKLLFMGSMSSQSILFDTERNLIADGTKTQNSINNIQLIQPKNGEDPYMALTHGYAPLPPEPYPSASSIAEVKMKLPLVFDSVLPVKTQSLHRYLKTLHLPTKKLLVLSNSRNTTFYSLENTNVIQLSQQDTPLVMDAVTLAIGLVASEKGDVIVQVCEKQIVAVWENTLVCSIPFNTTIKCVCFAEQCVFFTDTTNSLFRLRIVKEEPFYVIENCIQSTDNPITALFAFEAPEFKQYTKTYSLFHTGEEVIEDIRYATKEDCIEKKHIDSFVLGDHENVFDTQPKAESMEIEAEAEARVIEYIFVAFEDSSIICYDCASFTSQFKYNQLYTGATVLSPQSMTEEYGGSQSNSCSFIHFGLFGVSNQPELNVSVLTMGFNDGHLFVYKQQSPRSPCFIRCPISLTLNTPFIQTAIQPVVDTFMYQGLFLTGATPCFITVVHGEPQLLHLSGFTGCDQSPLLAVSTYDSNSCWSVVNASKGEELRIFSMPYLSPSSDSSSSLICINHYLPIPGNILRSLRVTVNEKEYTCLVMESSTGYAQDRSEIYDQKYYQHEQCLNPPLSIHHTLSISHNGTVIAELPFSSKDRVTCMKTASVVRHSRLYHLLFVGLCTLSGYTDYDFCTGSILVFDLGSLPSSPASPQRLEVYKEIETKPTIMQMDVMHIVRKDYDETFLVVAKSSYISSSASTVSLYSLRDMKEACSLTLTNYVSTLTAIKDCVLVGDIYNGLTFLAYREGMLKEMFYDHEPSHTLHSSCILTAKNMKMFFSKFDFMQNIEIFAIEDRRRLLKKVGDFHLPARVSSVTTIDVPSVECDKKNVGNLITTTEGAISIVIPLSGEDYTWLKVLQDDIVKNVPQYAALNNRNFRKYQPDGMLKYPRGNQLIDYSVISRFIHFPMNLRNEIATRIKINMSKIIEVIEKLDNSILAAF